MIQVVIAISCAYLSFFFAESELATSGVLTLVVAGIVVASAAWPRIVSKNTMRTIWHAIEFIGNTLIFVLAGLIFGNIRTSRRAMITHEDFFYLFIVYILTTLIRAIMVILLWIPLNQCGA